MMKITKYIHSCLLIEENNTAILIDPGNFSYDAKVLDISSLSKLDYILITHQHPDHCYLPFIKELLQKFPQTKIISNEAVAGMLKSENIIIQTSENDFIKMTPVNHERIFDKESPMNIQFDVFNKLSDPGDSLSFTAAKEVLALPITAPWGSTVWAYETAMKLKPKVIIPVHDWMWKDDFRKSMYERFHVLFGQSGIDFKVMESGQAVEV